MTRKITNRSIAPSYGRIRSPEDLGHLIRNERKRQALTLQDMYASTGLTTRFLSEFERGKPNASIRRVLSASQALGLEVLVLPRSQAEDVLSALARKQ